MIDKNRHAARSLRRHLTAALSRPLVSPDGDLADGESFDDVFLARDGLAPKRSFGSAVVGKIAIVGVVVVGATIAETALNPGSLIGGAKR